MSIDVKNVSKAFDHEQVIDHISLFIESGEFFVLLGTSGSGKSTLLRMVAGLTATDSGSIYLNHHDVTHLPPQKRGVGFVFQNYSLFQHLTVAENIAFGLDVKRLSKTEKVQRVKELLDLIDLSEYGDRHPAQLSGGQQQRVALARALAPSPEVLLLDEPFGALDVKIRSQLRQNLRIIQQQLKITTVLVTHDQDEAFELADRVGLIEAGQLRETGVPDELYRKPGHRYTATFLGQVNLMRGICNGAFLNVNGTKLPIPVEGQHLSGQTVDVMARPESIFLTRECEKQHGYVLGRGTVISMAFAGPMERIHVHLESGMDLQVLVNMNRTHELNLHLGTVVWASIRDYHLLPIAR